MTHPPITIWISAGEVSGDMYGAALATELLAQYPNVKLIGLGGEKMKAAGVHLLDNVTSASTIGFLEPIRHLKKYLSAYKITKTHLKKHNPDIVVAIDFQGFNMKVLGYAKKLGLKTAYFISPQEWQWGSDEGGKKVINAADTILAIFKQEYEFYKRLGGNVTFVGHPLLDTVHPVMTRTQFKTQFNLPDTKKWIAIFPGSRKQEITHVYPQLLKAAEKIHYAEPNTHLIISVAENGLHKSILALLEKCAAPYTVIKGHTHDIITHTDLSLCACGTITLEHAILAKPCVTGYRLNPISYTLAFAIVGQKWKDQVGFIALPNIYLKKAIIPEFIQDECNSTNILDAGLKLLTDPIHYQATQNHLKEVQKLLGQKGATHHAAKIILGIIQ